MSSFIADMEAFDLFEKTETVSPRRAVSIEWEKQAEVISAAIYESSAYIQSATARFADLTHHGVTFYAELKPGIHRLVRGERVFDILQVIRNGTKYSLTLREVSTDV